MEPQIVLKIDNNHTLKASKFKIFLEACPQTPLGACDYRTSVLMSTPNNFYPHTPMLTRFLQAVHVLTTTQNSRMWSESRCVISKGILQTTSCLQGIAVVVAIVANTALCLEKYWCVHIRDD